MHIRRSAGSIVFRLGDFEIAVLFQQLQNGKQFLRLDDVSNIEEGKMLSAGNTLTDVGFSKIFFCEIIAKEYHEELHRLHNLKRSSLGFQALTSYGQKEQEVMRKIGIEL